MNIYCGVPACLFLFRALPSNSSEEGIYSFGKSLLATINSSYRVSASSASTSSLSPTLRQIHKYIPKNCQRLSLEATQPNRWKQATNNSIWRTGGGSKGGYAKLLKNFVREERTEVLQTLQDQSCRPSRTSPADPPGPVLQTLQDRSCRPSRIPFYDMQYSALFLKSWTMRACHTSRPTDLFKQLVRLNWRH